nr:hypothetical protein [Marinicella sp. W31]MDC2877812.1 hypothetical protein [Marinicella sp. W31]
MDFRDKLKIKPGSTVRLADIDPSFHGNIEDKAAGKDALADVLDEITPLQEKLYAEKGTPFWSCCRALTRQARTASAGM